MGNIHAESSMATEINTNGDGGSGNVLLGFLLGGGAGGGRHRRLLHVGQLQEPHRRRWRPRAIITVEKKLDQRAVNQP